MEFLMQLNTENTDSTDLHRYLDEKHVGARGIRRGGSHEANTVTPAHFVTISPVPKTSLRPARSFVGAGAPLSWEHGPSRDGSTNRTGYAIGRLNV